MTARVVSCHGSRDGVRWGDIRFGWICRRWTLDLHTGTVRLYDMDDRHERFERPTEDLDPERVRAARQAIADFRCPS